MNTLIVITEKLPKSSNKENEMNQNMNTSITPYQQMMSSCTGALATSFFGIITNIKQIYIIFIIIEY